MTRFIQSKITPLILTLFLCLIVPVCSAAESKIVETDHVKSQLLSSVTAIEPGKPFDVALMFEIDEHWHTYYKNPGDSGLATSIQWDLPEGFTATEIQWPHPRRLPFGPLTNFGYEGTVFHVVTITPPAALNSADTITFQAKGSWLVCEEICIPGQANYTLSLPVGENQVTGYTELILDAKAEATQTLEGATFNTAANNLLLFLPGIAPESAPVFFPDTEGLIDNPAPQTVTAQAEGMILSIPLATNATLPETLSGRIVTTTGDRFGATIDAVPGDIALAAASQDLSSFLPTLLLGFIGGLILNLMPCVFPVLGIKVMGFVQQAGEDRKKVVAHGISFTAGVLVSFWVLAGVLLALRAGGQELGWGFQLQSPGFVFALMVFLFAFGLNLSGLFEFGASAVGIGSKLTSSSEMSGSFFSGVLATVVATPCAAPFLAPALGAALSLPAFFSLILFTSIALGLSAPYLILSLKPELTQFLPRPGAWMETFKQAMAFPLFSTAAYLLWVLDGQVGESQLLRIFFALAGVALALWIYGRWSTPVRSKLSRKVGVSVAGAVLLGTLIFAWPQTKQDSVPWQPWSKSLEQKLIEDERIVYIDFTARWCATCQTNKALVFSDSEVIQRFRKLNIATLKADWTNQDPSITQELASFGRSAVPFNLIYHPGQSEPTILPELLTPGMVLDVLDQK
ncbi:MAG: protein-disulfide reductase DsbD domain-containing protein [Verrucomicrobiota bacterium]